MGALVDVFVGGVVRGIQTLQDISESETKQLHQLLVLLQTQLQPLFVVRDPAKGATAVCAALGAQPARGGWQGPGGGGLTGLVRFAGLPESCRRSCRRRPTHTSGIA